MRERLLLALVALMACGGPNAQAAPTPPSTGELDTVPMEGYLERSATGCQYAAKPGDPLRNVKTCPPTMVKTSPPPKTLEKAPVGGFLEKSLDAKTCWWSMHVPYDCPKGAQCKPNPPVQQVACP